MNKFEDMYFHGLAGNIVVINKPMTVGELSDKIKKTPAEIIKR